VFKIIINNYSLGQCNRNETEWVFFETKRKECFCFTLSLELTPCSSSTTSYQSLYLLSHLCLRLPHRLSLQIRHSCHSELPQSFTPGLKPTCFTSHSHHRVDSLHPSELTHTLVPDHIGFLLRVRDAMIPWLLCCGPVPVCPPVRRDEKYNSLAGDIHYTYAIRRRRFRLRLKADWRQPDYCTARNHKQK